MSCLLHVLVRVSANRLLAINSFAHSSVPSLLLGRPGAMASPQGFIVIMFGVAVVPTTADGLTVTMKDPNPVTHPRDVRRLAAQALPDACPRCPSRAHADPLQTSCQTSWQVPGGDRGDRAHVGACHDGHHDSPIHAEASPAISLAMTTDDIMVHDEEHKMPLCPSVNTMAERGDRQGRYLLGEADFSRGFGVDQRLHESIIVRNGGGSLVAMPADSDNEMDECCSYGVFLSRHAGWHDGARPGADGNVSSLFFAPHGLAGSPDFQARNGLEDLLVALTAVFLVAYIWGRAIYDAYEMMGEGTGSRAAHRVQMGPTVAPGRGATGRVVAAGALSFYSYGIYGPLVYLSQSSGAFDPLVCGLQPSWVIAMLAGYDIVINVVSAVLRPVATIFAPAGTLGPRPAGRDRRL